MKAIFVSFNQAYYEMILNVMDRNNIRGFTYWNEVQGRGSKTLWKSCLADTELGNPGNGR